MCVSVRVWVCVCVSRSSEESPFCLTFGDVLQVLRLFEAHGCMAGVHAFPLPASPLDSLRSLGLRRSEV